MESVEKCSDMENVFRNLIYLIQVQRRKEKILKETI